MVDTVLDKLLEGLVKKFGGQEFKHFSLMNVAKYQFAVMKELKISAPKQSLNNSDVEIVSNFERSPLKEVMKDLLLWIDKGFYVIHGVSNSFVQGISHFILTVLARSTENENDLVMYNSLAPGNSSSMKYNPKENHHHVEEKAIAEAIKKVEVKWNGFNIVKKECRQQDGL